jgi:hypothetical protein
MVRQHFLTERFFGSMLADDVDEFWFVVFHGRTGFESEDLSYCSIGLAW